jgi:hypothetical protein
VTALGVDKLFLPGPTRVFVFGSNTAGIHGAGAARTAHRHYGAVWGQGEGWMPALSTLVAGAYGIPTKDGRLATRSLEAIQISVDRFLRFARDTPRLSFFVTRVGCGLAGYDDGVIAPMFQGAPNNCELPYGWP